jgi:hypothetical protein
MASRQHFLAAINHQEPDRVPLDIGSGFIAAAVHNIQADVSPENIIPMADAVRRYGGFPIHTGA